jgi:hypothetical protein
LQVETGAAESSRSSSAIFKRNLQAQSSSAIFKRNLQAQSSSAVFKRNRYRQVISVAKDFNARVSREETTSKWAVALSDEANRPFKARL